jgi:hypothetical protein
LLSPYCRRDYFFIPSKILVLNLIFTNPIAVGLF